MRYDFYTYNLGVSGVSKIVWDNGLLDGNGGNWWQGVENLSFNGAAATPEPGTMLMFGTGILGLAGTVRRRFCV